ncbi:MAG: glycosyltransferase family 39 protein, partial [Firmicutes bacterium]|nr:glycosyltransferase family 39 protein [Bacillota bacterium]
MKKYGTFRCWGFFFLYSALLMLFCTKSSPLFVFNNWTDANAAFTMGKSMMRGLAPYKDLFNHKGPFLYLLYGLAYLMHNTGFYGLYVLQSLSMAVLLFFCYRIARLYIQRDGVAMGVALLVPVFVLARGIYVTEFDYGGGSAEEFMLPLIAMSVYSVARYAQDDGCRYEKPLRAVCLIQGVVFVLMFMTKFTIAVFSLGLLFPFFVDMLCKRKWKALCQAVAYTLMGIGLASLPYLVYALCTNSLSAFGEVYIRINILYSGTEGAGILKKAFQTINQTVSFMLSNDTKKALPSLLTLLGFGFAVFMDKARPLAYRLSVLLGWALLFLSESIRPFTYSYIIMMFYPLFGLIALAKAALYFRGRFSVSEASRSSHKAEGAALRAAIVFLAAGLTIGG